MRMFEMQRIEDETGVSGTGKVLEGVVFSDGPCVVRWTTELNGRSESRYDSFGTFIAIHVTPHPTNKTIITFNDGEVYDHATAKAGILKPKRKRKAKLPEMASQEVGKQDVGPGDPNGSPAKVPHEPSKEA